MSELIETIKNIENKFKTSLKDSSGTIFKIIETIPISNITNIYRIDPGYNTYYYTTSAIKSKICLHFTAGTITGDIASLTKKNNCLSVHYVVDRMGNIYNLIPLDKNKNWSYHLGANTIGTNTAMSKATIGIEISNYGPLIKKTDGYYNTYKQKYSSDESDIEKVSFRGYDYYCSMTPIQKQAVLELIDYICKQCNIKHEYKLDGMFSSDKEAIEFNGIFTHAQVRKDKFDWPYELIKFVKDDKKIDNNIESNTKTEDILEFKQINSEILNDPILNYEFENKPKEEINTDSQVKIQPIQNSEKSEKSESLIMSIINMILKLFEK